MFYHPKGLNLLNDTIRNSTILSFLNSYIIIIIASVICTSTFFFMISNTFLTIFNQKTKLSKKIIVSILFGALYQGTTFFVNTIRRYFITFKIEDLFAVYIPVYIFIVYFIFTKIYKVHKDKCVSQLFKIYILLVLSIIMYYFLEALCFYIISNDKTQQFIVFIIVDILCLFFFRLECFIFLLGMQKLNLWNKDNYYYLANSKTRMLYYFLASCGIYSVIYIALFAIRDSTSLSVILLSLGAIIAVGFFAVYVLLCIDRIKINKEIIENTNLYTTSLSNSVEEFRLLKHDIANILQVYEGYLKIEDYEGLKNYHQKAYNKTKKIFSSLIFSKNMHNNPSLYTIMMEKISEALKKNIRIQVKCDPNLSQIAIDDIILEDIVDNLFSLAIQESLKFNQSTIYIALKMTKHKKILFVTTYYSNSIKPTEPITTKKKLKDPLQHIITLVTKIINCNINIEKNENLLTLYLELPCNAQTDRRLLNL